MEEKKKTLCKQERQNKRLIINRLFESGSKSFSLFPLRVVFIPMEKTEKVSAAILVSVPKRYFKQAVKRNHVKRQIREAYRKNKPLLLDQLNKKTFGLTIAFIWIDKEFHPSEEIDRKIRVALKRITELIP